jgi:hypothetical protein
MKSLALKFATRERDATGNYEVSNETRIINQYSRLYAPETMEVNEDSDVRLYRDHEFVRAVGFPDFWDRMRRDEGVVVQIESATTKEKQSKPPEGSDSGETRG